MSSFTSGCMMHFPCFGASQMAANIRDLKRDAFRCVLQFSGQFLKIFLCCCCSFHPLVAPLKSLWFLLGHALSQLPVVVCFGGVGGFAHLPRGCLPCTCFASLLPHGWCCFSLVVGVAPGFLGPTP